MTRSFLPVARTRRLLCPAGATAVVLPNAQSGEGPFWAYEDSTHHTLFTPGSFDCVLTAAGFADVQLPDPDGLQGLLVWKRAPRAVLPGAYKLSYRFWNRVTADVVRRAWHLGL